MDENEATEIARQVVDGLAEKKVKVVGTSSALVTALVFIGGYIGLKRWVRREARRQLAIEKDENESK